jgi:hypothetical protein
MNNSKGEMTQNDERPLSNRETREMLRLTICLEHGPIGKGDHAEVQRRHKLLRTVPSQMKHHFKGYKEQALEYKANLVRNMAEWFNDDAWLTNLRARYSDSVDGMVDAFKRALVKQGTFDSEGDIERTIRLVSEPSFAAKHWKTEGVAA